VRLIRYGALVASIIFGTACGDVGSQVVEFPEDSGNIQLADSGPPVNDSGQSDTGRPPTKDTGPSEDVTPPGDSNEPPDTNTPPVTDSGSPDSNAADNSSPPVDTGAPVTDSGTPPTTDGSGSDTGCCENTYVACVCACQDVASCDHERCIEKCECELVACENGKEACCAF
jgi:hypothetical protein